MGSSRYNSNNKKSNTKNLSEQFNNIYQQYLEESKSDSFREILKARRDSKDSIVEFSEADITQYNSIQSLVRPLYGKGSPQLPDIGDHPDFNQLKGTDRTEHCAITTMFMDIEGSTKLRFFYSLDEVRHIKNTLIRVTMELIKCFDGHVHRIMGDAVMAYFGGRNTSPETSIIDGINCASLLRYFVESITLPALKLEGYDRSVGIRIGLDFGSKDDVLWSSYGYPGMEEVTATSFFVDVASKLQHSAGRNQIMIGNSLKSLIDVPEELLKVKTRIKSGDTVKVPYLEPNHSDSDGKKINYKQFIFDSEKYLEFSPISFKERNVSALSNSKINFNARVEVYSDKKGSLEQSYLSCACTVEKHKYLKFIVDTGLLLHLRPYTLKFIVENHGQEAFEECGEELDNHSTVRRIEKNNNSYQIHSWESTLYRGLHYMKIELRTDTGVQTSISYGIYVE